MIVKF